MNGTSDTETTSDRTSTLRPRGEFERSARTVIGRFAHVRQDSDGDSTDVHGGDWFADPDEEWTTEKQTDHRAVSCDGERA